jgi:hypothetical protein
VNFFFIKTKETFNQQPTDLPQLFSNFFSTAELCNNDGSHTDEEIIVKPTQKDTTSIVYETVFDDNNNIDFNVETTSRKPKS